MCKKNFGKDNKKTLTFDSDHDFFLSEKLKIWKPENFQILRFSDFKVLKCSVNTYHKDTAYYNSFGWFYIEINNTYKVYYYLQFDFTGESCCQYASNSVGESWAFKNAITTNVLNKKLKDFVEKENLKI